jgi:hypothetical protein
VERLQDIMIAKYPTQTNKCGWGSHGGVVGDGERKRYANPHDFSWKDEKEEHVQDNRGGEQLSGI